MAKDFQTGKFATLSSSQLIVILLTLGKFKVTPQLFILANFGQVTVILLSLGKTLGREKQLGVGYGLSHFK